MYLEYILIGFKTDFSDSGSYRMIIIKNVSS